jgi:hypothetical protein
LFAKIACRELTMPPPDRQGACVSRLLFAPSAQDIWHRAHSIW